MKRIAALVMLLFCGTIVWAAPSAESARRFEEEQRQAQAAVEPLVQPAVESLSGSEIHSLTPVSLEVGAYDPAEGYTYCYSQDFLVLLYRKEGSWKNAGTDHIQMIIPVKMKNDKAGELVFTEKEGAFHFSGMNYDKEFNLISGFSRIREDLKKATDRLPEVSSVQMLYSLLHRSFYVLLDAGEKEYVIPYTGYEKELGITSGEVIELGELVRKLDAVFDEEAVLKAAEKGEKQWGGSPLRDNTTPASGSGTWLLAGGLGGGALLGAALILLPRLKRSHS